MNRVLVLYPELFTCQSKFDRKASNIVSRMECFDILWLNDENQFIKNLFNEDSRVVDRIQLVTLENQNITHAVVFDDGEEFQKELEWLEIQEIPTRIINTLITRVINIKKDDKYKNLKSTSTYEYIGRGSYWGNPYSMYDEGEDRDEVIRKYKYDFDFEKFPNKDKSLVHKLAGKRLGCFCKPEVCHGDVLANYLNSFDDGI